MQRGHLILMLLGVMIVMTLITQNLKQLTPLLTGVKNTQNNAAQSLQEKDLLKQLGLSSSQAFQKKNLQGLLDKISTSFTPKKNAAQETNSPLKEASLFQDWMNETLSSTKKIKPVNPTSLDEENTATFLSIRMEYPPEIINPNFTPRQLRSARIRLRELRLNHEDTAQDVRASFGKKAEEEVKQMFLKTENDAVDIAQTAPSWNQFEKGLVKIKDKSEKQLKSIILNYLK